MLLRWYDVHARTLPWRAAPGQQAPDPYRVWLSEVMLQQTTVAAVVPYFAKFTQAWPTVQTLAAAETADVMSAWAGLGYYARARNLVACAKAVAELGHFPNTEDGLRALPGIGAYTAAAIAAIAFGRRAVVVDGNVERVVARLFVVETPLPAAKPQLYRLTDTITPDAHSGDFAQAMMDLGATICTPRNPSCLVCPLAERCAARTAGDPAQYPKRLPKIAKPVRHWVALWVERDGCVLLVRRPDKGLLGGMLALPSSVAPTSAGTTLGVVTHVFTHFTLHLSVHRAAPDEGCPLQLGGQWWDIAKLGEAGLPTLFAKATRVAMMEE
ncbi:MAG: A/G-specific adenine glycosylase [Sphingomonadales bacterium]